MIALATPFDWKRPDYAAVLAQRVERLARIRANPATLPPLKLYYRDHIARLISDWGLSSDPRNIERGLPATVPLILFPKQVEMVNWILERWRLQQPGLIEKSRDVGASVVTMALACSLCLLYPGITVGVGSRKEALVDNAGDPGTLFFKARQFLQGLPPEFRGGWDVNKHSAHMRLTFPQTGSALVGEAGDQIGRGGRSSLFILDESGFVDRAELIEASLSANTNCRIDCSSVNGMNNVFGQKRWSGRVPVFTFGWRDDPRKDDQWYAKKCSELDPVTVASEIDLSYSASLEGQLIPAAWIEAAVGAHLKLRIEPTGTRRAGLDVADQGRDLNAFAGRHGCLLYALEQWSGKSGDIFGSVVKAFDLCDQHGIEYLDYDSDGLGSGVRGDARVANERRAARQGRPIYDTPFRGSASPSDPDGEMVRERKNKDFFSNMKSMSWWHLRTRFQQTYRAIVEGLPYDADNLISLAPDLSHLSALKVELSQVTYKLNTAGKVVIDKIGDGMRSPNLADATMIAFNPGPHAVEIWAMLGRLP